MIATSTHGSATGKGGKRVVCDDLMNPEQAYSETERKTGNRQYDPKCSNRLDDKRRNAIFVVMHRLHELTKPDTYSKS